MQIQNVPATKHLTASNRKVIAQMLERGWESAHTPRAQYSLTRDGEQYQVTIMTSERDDYGREQSRRHVVPFTVAP